MSMTTPASVLAGSPKPIKGAGLTNPGIVILQFLFILLVETTEYWASKVGAFTGIAIWVAIFGGIYLGRSGTSFASAVNPPIAFFFSTLILVGTIGGAGLHKIWIRYGHRSGWRRPVFGHWNSDCLGLAFLFAATKNNRRY